jgi:hypothetical protein
MKPFHWIMGVLAALIVVLVVVGGGVYAYNHVPGFKSSVQTELDATKTDARAAELTQLRAEVADMKAKFAALESTPTPAAAPTPAPAAAVPVPTPTPTPAAVAPAAPSPAATDETNVNWTPPVEPEGVVRHAKQTPPTTVLSGADDPSGQPFCTKYDHGKLFKGWVGKGLQRHAFCV